VHFNGELVGFAHVLPDRQYRDANTPLPLCQRY
jgi:hypothetical protein